MDIEIEIKSAPTRGHRLFRPVCRALDFLSGHPSVNAVYADQTRSLSRFNIRGDTAAIFIIPTTGRR